MAKKRKKAFGDVAVKMVADLHALSLDPDADYDACERAAKEVATAAGLRKRTHRRKSLDALIEEREIKEAAREAAEAKKAEKRKKDKAARDRRKKAEKARKGK